MGGEKEVDLENVELGFGVKRLVSAFGFDALKFKGVRVGSVFFGVRF